MNKLGIVLLFVMGIFLLISCAGSTPVIRDYKGNPVENSISEMVQIEAQGIKQYLLIRGQDQNKPVLLFLHGGPGVSELPLVRKYNSELEKHFVFVQWEQPGAGKSFKGEYKPGFLDNRTLVQLGFDITDYLKKRFGKKKIYLLGHCFGTLIGVEMIRERPEDFKAYIGVTQHVNLRRNLTASYDYLLEFYKKEKKQKALAELEFIATLFNSESDVHYFSANRKDKKKLYEKWLEQTGEFYYGEQKTPKSFEEAYFQSHEYNLWDLLNITKGPVLLRPLADAWIDLDYLIECPRLEVPVWFVNGARDAHVRIDLTKEWFDLLEAPKKAFLEFQNSAHFPLFEEAEKFNQLMVNILEDCEAEDLQ